MSGEDDDDDDERAPDDVTGGDGDGRAELRSCEQPRELVEAASAPLLEEAVDGEARDGDDADDDDRP